MSSSIGLRIHRVTAIVAAVFLSACQSNGLTTQSTSGFQPGVVPAKTGVQPQKQTNLYTVTELPTFGGDYAIGTGVNNRGSVSGFAYFPYDAYSHAALWVGNGITDLGTVGGPNSAGDGQMSNSEIVASNSDSSTYDPYGEGWCFGDPYTCVPFFWRAGKIHTLPTLGGPNGFAWSVNSAGYVAGRAETATQDPSCVLPQVFDFSAVRWDRDGHVKQLPNLPGDSVSVADGINAAGDVTGSSGPCALDLTTEAHAVLWPRHGSPINLPTLGGAYPNFAKAINNHGDIAGESEVASGAATHSVLWKKGYGKVIDLGTLPGYPSEYTEGINSKDQIVGYAFDAYGNTEGFLWENGTMYDLTTLIAPSSNLDVVLAWNINDAGVITGQVCDPSGYCPAFRATLNGHKGAPIHRQKTALPERARQQLMRELRTFGFGPIHR